MFGYIIVNKAEMKFKEFDVYHSFYCGICRELKKKYGFLGQMSLSYDMTFLAILLTGLYEPQTRLGSCKCVAHPFESHGTRNNIFTEYAADMNLLFACFKCRDDWEDERKAWKFLFGRLLEGKAGRLKEVYREKVKAVRLLMQDFTEAEQAQPMDIDAVSGCFGRVMGEIMAVREDEWEEGLRGLGFYLGKFIYLLDAYEDVEKDRKTGNYNLFLQESETEEFERKTEAVLSMMMAECSRAFERLPIVENTEILRNILYSGVWCRYEYVKKSRERKVTDV